MKTKKDDGILEIGIGTISSTFMDIDAWRNVDSGLDNDPYRGDPYDDYDELDTNDLKELLEIYKEEFKSGERYEQDEPDYVWMRGKKIDMNKKSCLKKIESIIAKESKS
jgi:hypothetical protein